MSYDESIQRAEVIIAQLEQSEALSMDEYKRLASEATALLKQCKSEIEYFSKELQAYFPSSNGWVCLYSWIRELNFQARAVE